MFGFLLIRIWFTNILIIGKSLSRMSNFIWVIHGTLQHLWKFCISIMKHFNFYKRLLTYTIRKWIKKLETFYHQTWFTFVRVYYHHLSIYFIFIIIIIYSSPKITFLNLYLINISEQPTSTYFLFILIWDNNIITMIFTATNWWSLILDSFFLYPHLLLTG